MGFIIETRRTKGAGRHLKRDNEINDEYCCTIFDFTYVYVYINIEQISRITIQLFPDIRSCVISWLGGSR